MIINRFKIPNTGDESNSLPMLQPFIQASCISVPGGPSGPKEKLYEEVKNAGFTGIQDGDPMVCQKLGLKYSTGGRINSTSVVESLVKSTKDQGSECLTLHVGWGIESDHEVDLLVEEVLKQAYLQQFPVFIEIHRATITVDMWRTVELVKRFPEIRFNGDFSHWYTGQEMVYGGFDMKTDFIAPVLERVRYIHGRIGNPGSIQVAVDDQQQLNVQHFKFLWEASFKGFIDSAAKGEYFTFCSELLFPEVFYARVFRNESGELVEESNRWEQAKLLCQIAKECWRDVMEKNKETFAISTQ